MSRRKIASEPKWITREIVAILHAQQVERFGGLHGVRDKSVVLSPIARPINRWAYDDDADLADLAALYLIALATSQGFNDGNKRTALAATLVFLEMNGMSVDAESQELFELTLAAATKRQSAGPISEWLRGHTRRASG